jgi:serine protease SohB
MEFLHDYGLFLAKTLTLLAAVIVILMALFNQLRANKPPPGTGASIRVDHLNREYDQAALTLKAAMLSGKAAKTERKALAKRRRLGTDGERRHLFVVDFEGDLRASAVAALRDEITAILTVAGEDDEVLVRLESPGGIVHGYGLAASQLVRVRDRGLALTVAVDKIAASGGYLMACVGQRVLAAPFAIIGSIGVVAQMPNFNRLLKKHDIEFEQFTAGEHKRTVTLFGKNTPAGREKLQREIEDVHSLFKDFIADYRPQVDLAEVATGQYWYGTRALEHKLVDELKTSDDYLLESSRDAEIFRVHSARPKPWLARLLSQTSEAWSRIR